MRASAALAVGLAWVCAGLGGTRQEAVDLRSDSTLVAFLRRTDPVFRGVLGRCWRERVNREGTGRSRSFSYRAICDQSPPSSADDCADYEVRAYGTIDTPAWATIRRWELRLQCGG